MPVPGIAWVIGGNYLYNNIHWGDGGGHQLNAATLRYHLLDKNNTQGASACIRELSRLFLAQIPAAGGVGLGPHNVGVNNGSDNTIAAKAVGRHNCEDIFMACNTLKEHMLIHGHLGYFILL